MSEIQTKLCLAWFIARDTVPHTTAHRYKGYQGIVKIHELSEIPVRKPRGKNYSEEQRKYNRELGRIRVAVENVNRCLKIFKILSYPYRNRRYKFGLRSHLIAGIYNNDLGSKA